MVVEREAPMLQIHWKNTADDLRARAARVTDDVGAVVRMAGPGSKLTARVAAQILSGIVSHVANTYGKDEMQAACATLVRNEPTWQTPGVVRVPADHDGRVSEAVKLIALVAHGILPLAGADNVRDALSFWATEDDTGVWTRVVGS